MIIVLKEILCILTTVAWWFDGWLFILAACIRIPDHLVSAFAMLWASCWCWTIGFFTMGWRGPFRLWMNIHAYPLNKIM